MHTFYEMIVFIGIYIAPFGFLASLILLLRALYKKNMKAVKIFVSLVVLFTLNMGCVFYQIAKLMTEMD